MQVLMSTQDKQLIFSVKHSGTRSLRKHIPSITGWTHYPDDGNYGGDLVDTGEWLADNGVVHFGDGSWRKMLQWEGRVDIPIRNPMAIAQSWAGRYGMTERTITEVLHDLTEAFRERYFRRMWDLSQFMKTLKQRFTSWFNRQHDRRGDGQG